LICANARYEFDTYKKFSLSFYTVLMGYADELQAVSVDEALIDVTSAVRAKEMAPEEHTDIEPGQAPKSRDVALELAEMIRNDVRKLTDCEGTFNPMIELMVVSIGISHNVLLAKLATRAAKPAGAYHLTAPLVPKFLEDLDVKDLPSIGYSTASKIEEKFGTTKCGPLLEISKSALQKTLGPKTGEMVFGYLRGVDERRLEPHKERKSISAEMNVSLLQPFRCGAAYDSTGSGLGIKNKLIFVFEI
jgi:DNA repair protein REV1